jgi:hypothetical protein
VPDEFGSDGARARPCLDNTFFTGGVERAHFFEDTRVDVRSFFQTASHSDCLRE